MKSNRQLTVLSSQSQYTSANMPLKGAVLQWGRGLIQWLSLAQVSSSKTADISYGILKT